MLACMSSRSIGRQYEGLLMAGPTMMILNIAPGRGSPGGGVTAYTDLLTNEFCALELKKDVDTHLHGQ
jgi:hypothetical protein